MPYCVTIRKNATGEIRAKEYPYEWSEGQLFWWTEGNFGCDCNRALAFERAAGLDPDIDDTECGHSAFTVLSAELPDGTVVRVDP